MFRGYASKAIFLSWPSKSARMVSSCQGACWPSVSAIAGGNRKWLAKPKGGGNPRACRPQGIFWTLPFSSFAALTGVPLRRQTNCIQDIGSLWHVLGSSLGGPKPLCPVSCGNNDVSERSLRAHKDGNGRIRISSWSALDHGLEHWRDQDHSH